MIPLLFFCSGATALIYEVIWAKYLALMFGSTIQAQTIVLAVFMGGLALGNHLFGRRADWLQRPLAAYGYVEVVIGLYAFFFHYVFQAADGVFVSAGSRVFGYSFVLFALKSVLSVILLLGPTVLMGGTLPLLAAWLQQSGAEAGRRSARFYSINSLGAVTGAGLAGFVLVASLGLVSTLQMTALVNVLIGITAVGIARRRAAVPDAAIAPEPAAETSDTPSTLTIGWACLMVSLTGAISMSLELLASRSLALIVGPSSQSFALVLMAFILGIGLGSAVVASPSWRKLPDEISAGKVLFAAGVVVGVYVLCIDQWVLFYSAARMGLANNGIGYFYHQLLVGLMALIVLGLPAGLIGAVLPLSIRLLSGGSHTLGRHVGRLLTWNTIGAVVGVLFTGFFLMPTLGVRSALIAMALLLVALAATVAWLKQYRSMAVIAFLWCAGLTWKAAESGEGWQQVLSSGIFRARILLNQEALDLRRRAIKIKYYKDGPDATVSVEMPTEGADSGHRTLRINGKPDASTHGDLSTQYLMAHLPMLARPDSKEAFVLGFGSGITAGALLGHPLDRITVAENCRPVLEAASSFAEWNRGVLTNARARVLNEDARTVLKLDPQRYDVIICEPSNPWVAGIGSVFSKEFYELAGSRLTDGGMVAQWFHIYEMNDAILMLVLRTFQSVFPYVEVWEPQAGDLILLGAKQPWHAGPDTFKKVYERPQPRADLERISLAGPELIWLRQMSSQQTSFAIPGEGARQSDFFPVLEYAAPQAFFIGEAASAFRTFDERTWQSMFAPEEKQRSLGALSDAAVRSAFGEFKTSNGDLQQFVQWRIERLANTNQPPEYLAEPYIPIIFRDAASYPRAVALSAQTSPELKQLTAALGVLYTEPARALESIQLIEDIVRAQAGRTNPATAPKDWRVGAYAAVAAKARAARKDHEGALKFLNDAIPIAPDDVQLPYLKRLLEGSAAGTK